MNTDITQLAPNVFVSNWDTSNNIDILKMYNIKAVLTIETRPKPEKILNYYTYNNIDFGYIYLPDIYYANISEYFDSTFQFIENHTSRGENVLVHCWAGISRSVTIILNYVLKKYYLKYKHWGIDPEIMINNTILNLRHGRPIINPNSGFLEQLKNKCLKYKRGIFNG